MELIIDRLVVLVRKKISFQLCVVLEETDETLYWLELISETRLLVPNMMNSLIQEGNELLATW